MTYWTTPMRYVDYFTEDLYFDRVATVTLNISNWNGNGEEFAKIGIGIWIATDRILTSYNPYRSIVKNKTLLHNLVCSALYGRSVINHTGHYITKYTGLACGRQVQYLPEDKIDDNLWHGVDPKNCPVHDLMVFRIYGNHTLSTAKPEQHYNPFYLGERDIVVNTKLLLTELATPLDFLGAELKYAHLVDYLLKLFTYGPDENAVLDCDMWLPREWGHFICIRNKDKNMKLGSGAVLISNDKLFGIGSFLLARGNESICVFTDVRPYYELIMNTCTYADSEETPPNRFY